MEYIEFRPNNLIIFCCCIYNEKNIDVEKRKNDWIKNNKDKIKIYYEYCDFDVYKIKYYKINSF